MLAQAGVVDAGGTGYLLLLDALLTAVDGRPLPEAPAADPDAPSVLAASEADGSEFGRPRAEAKASGSKARGDTCATR